jgi:hypothetical protein
MLSRTELKWEDDIRFSVRRNPVDSLLKSFDDTMLEVRVICRLFAVGAVDIFGALLTPSGFRNGSRPTKLTSH